MKLVIDARESGTSTGRYVDKLIEYLHRLKPGFEVIILTKSPRINFYHKIAPDFQVVKSDFKEFTFAEQIGLLRQLKSLNADLVHFTMTQQPVLYKGASITTIHDLTTVRFDNPSKNKLIFKLKQRVYRYVVKNVAKKSKYILTASEYVKHDVAQYAKINSRKIGVTYEAADRITEPAKQLPRLAGKKFIMYLGRPLPHKNLQRLIKAFSVLKDNHPELILVLAGRYDTNYKKISEFVTEKRLADSVVFTDFITEGELKWLYENTQAYVFPSLSEGFGLPGLEAMMHGAPVVSSNATCLPEIYGNGAHYFDPTDINDMVDKIGEVLDNPRLRAGLIGRGATQADKYSWKRLAMQTLIVYEKASNQKSKAGQSAD